MSTTVEIYLADPEGLVPLAQRVARPLRVPEFYLSADSVVYSLPAREWIGADGTGLLTLEERDADFGEGTALDEYGYELSLEYRGGPAVARSELRERFGREIFERLRVLDLPLALADFRSLFLDYRPERGVRDFGSGVSWSASGRDRWAESVPGEEAVPARPGPPVSAARSVTVFEGEGLLQIVPRKDGGTLAPVISLHPAEGARTLGRCLAQALDGSWDGGYDVDARFLAEQVGSSAEEFARGAVSVDLEPGEGTLTATPRAPAADGGFGDLPQGPAQETLATREPGPWNDEAVGALVLRLLTTVRQSAVGQ